jgi:Family of unknown function (DUF5677)
MTVNQQIIFGMPEFGKEVQARFPKLFEVLPRVTASLNDLTSRAIDKPEMHQRVILNLGLLAGVSMLELVTLAGHGLGQGAMKIARTLMETAINAEYLRQFPAEIDEYLKWAWIEKKKDLLYVQTNLKYLLPEIGEEAVQSIEKEYAACKHLFEKPNGEVRSSWCRLNLADRAIRVGIADTYRRVNPLSSAFIHGTINGLSKHFDLTKDVDRISLPPSLEYCDYALLTGHQCICFVVETLSRTFGLEPVHSVASLTEDLKYAWPLPEQQKEVAPADPAPAVKK